MACVLIVSRVCFASSHYASWLNIAEPGRRTRVQVWFSPSLPIQSKQQAHMKEEQISAPSSIWAARLLRDCGFSAGFNGIAAGAMASVLRSMCSTVSLPGPPARMDDSAIELTLHSSQNETRKDMMRGKDCTLVNFMGTAPWSLALAKAAHTQPYTMRTLLLQAVYFSPQACWRPMQQEATWRILRLCWGHALQLLGAAPDSHGNACI